MDKTQVITDATSLALKLCLDRYLELPGKQDELIRWFASWSGDKALPDYKDFSHETYRSFLVWVPDEMEVDITKIFFDKNGEVQIRGYFSYDSRYGDVVVDFWYSSRKIIGKLDVFIDPDGYSHEVVKLPSARVYDFLAKVSKSYPHLGLDADSDPNS